MCLGLHHIIARGIARRKVFDDNTDSEGAIADSFFQQRAKEKTMKKNHLAFHDGFNRDDIDPGCNR
ncbi:MAG: hypothetical protein C4530_03150 [Desulfobacteraceae bacterium]|nr:MAG: hypothetical protein C4530_03150 [Desulfobacteraceae bacterium]